MEIAQAAIASQNNDAAAQPESLGCIIHFIDEPCIIVF